MSVAPKIKGSPAAMQINRANHPPLHVMLDLETLSQTSDALIMSIGAVKFDLDHYDPDSSGVGHFDPFPDEFHVGIDITEEVSARLNISGSTVRWWFDQARHPALIAWLALEKMDLATALEGFRLWYGSDPLPVWGNGAGFDNVILRHAFESSGLQCPFTYRDDRCFRTMNALAQFPWPSDGSGWGPAHTALNDARRQARRLQQIISGVSGFGI